MRVFPFLSVFCHRYRVSIILRLRTPFKIFKSVIRSYCVNVVDVWFVKRIWKKCHSNDTMNPHKFTRFVRSVTKKILKITRLA